MEWEGGVSGLFADMGWKGVGPEEGVRGWGWCGVRNLAAPIPGRRALCPLRFNSYLFAPALFSGNLTCAGADVTHKFRVGGKSVSHT